MIGCFGLFNWIVDPYWYFRDIELIGFNVIKPKASGNERLVKPALMARLRSEAVIVGNSAAEVGLPPTHRGFTQGGTLAPFNLAVPSATWNEVYCLAMFALRQPSVKRLVVAVTGTDEGACPSDAALGKPDYGKLLFSRSAFDASRETMRMQSQRASMTREGLWYFDRYERDRQTDEAVTENFAAVMQSALCREASGGAEAAVDKALPHGSAVPHNQGAGLRKLIRLALQRNVELILLFYPNHVLLSEARRSCQGPGWYWNWLWQTVSIVDQETHGDSHQVQVWQFADYAPINGERIHAGKPARDRLWQDAIHFNEEVGAAAFDAIYLGHPRYGARVTVENFDEVVARSEDERRTFLANNPWVRKELDELARRVAGSSAQSRP
jgi:hypothetical protein